PKTPTRLEQKVEGGLERDDGLALLVFKDKEAELIDKNGVVLETMAQHPNGHLCGQCKETHYSHWKPTNLRGIPGEMLTATEKFRGKLVTHRREPRGWVAFENGQDKYQVEWSVRDLDGDGFDEVYLLDFAGKTLTLQRDPAACLRQQLIPHHKALSARKGAALTLTQGVKNAALQKHIKAQIAAQGKKATGLSDQVFAPLLAMVDDVREAAEVLYKALDTVQESFPERVVVKDVKLARSELDRLKKVYLSENYSVKKYPFAKAMKEGHVESYGEFLARDDIPGGQTHPNQPYLRNLIGCHMQMAREVGLAPILRERVLNLVEQMLDLVEAPSVWLTVSAKERNDGYFKVKESVSEDCVVNNHVNDGMRKKLAALEKSWKLGAFEWSTGPSDSIYDLEIRGIRKWGDVTLKATFGVEQGDSMVMQDEPFMGGPLNAVVSALDKLNTVAFWEESHEGEPKRAWGGTKDNPWATLDEWMLPEEIDSMRREVAKLRKLEPSETTVGPAAHPGLLALMARTWGFREDTAKVLAALLLQPMFDRERLGNWSGIESKKLLPHFKKLIAAKLLEKAEQNEYLFTTPKIKSRGYGRGPTTAFKRLFFTIATMEGNRENGRTRVALRFSEADVLRHYLMTVGKVKAEAIDEALTSSPVVPTTDTKAASKKKATKKTVSKKATAATMTGTRYFKLSDGSSHKFWEITLAASQHTVRYGRIGANGQSKTKSFGTDTAAQTDADKLIRQKTNKGYEEH
ncbi:MAG: WGR domain-containing protein, partial [Deltaproteobacteria bacterium]|nr:WGR domain-containing protein [Deltaproteobacteria bacterium]